MVTVIIQENHLYRLMNYNNLKSLLLGEKVVDLTLHVYACLVLVIVYFDGITQSVISLAQVTATI